MASSSSSTVFTTLLLPLLLSSLFCHLSSAALVEQPPLVLRYHNGPLLKGNYTLDLVWYGTFSSSQRAVILDFLLSLSPSPMDPSPPPPPSVSSWWQTTERYKGGSTAFSLGKQIFHSPAPSTHSPLVSSDLMRLASRTNTSPRTITVVLTAADVAVEGFCSSRCGTHGSLPSPKRAYAWVGNAATQCPGQCAWPFHQPIYGPQTPPLVAPSGDVGVDGMVINLATVLAGAVTNPFGDGYFQADEGAAAGLEAVSACAGVFGKGAYPGYSGEVFVDKTSGASFNAHGVNGRKYLLPAMWDPRTSECAPLV